MACGACGGTDLTRLWVDVDGCVWHRCTTCGSDTNESPYDPTPYLEAAYPAGLFASEGPKPLDNHALTADLFGDGTGRTVLDVGCGAGTSLEVLRTRGWVTTGWDVSGAGRPAGTVVSEVFSAALFARPFDAVLCREVLEHVPDPIGLLRELRAATAGTLQLTTPRPITTGSEPRVYHRHHLTIWSPDRLAAALDAAGFDVVISDVWELGQRYVATPPPRNTSAPGS